jgi:hypothetical protein
MHFEDNHSEQNPEEIVNGQDEFVPPFHAEEILGKSTKYKIHKKPLLNAESMLLKGKHRSALEIYSRILPRFQDKEVREKLVQIITDLQAFLKEKEPHVETKKLVLQPEKDFSSALRELTDDLTHSLKEGLNQLEDIHSELSEDISDKNEPKVNTVPIFIPTSTFDVGPGNHGNLPTMEYPNLDQGNNLDTSNPLGIQPGSLKREDLFGVYVPPNFPKEQASTQKLDIFLKSEEGEKLTPEEQVREDMNQALHDKMDLGLPSGEWIQRPPSENQSFLPQRSPVDVISDLYHSPDWNPFRNLPVSDRRTGAERRKVKKPIQAERRTGLERRKVDLFQQREEFLKDWAVKLQSDQGRQEYLQSLGSLGSSGEFSSGDFGLLGGDIRTTQGDVDLLEIGLPDPVESKINETQPFDQNQIPESVSSPPAIQDIPTEPVKYQVANEEFIRDLAREINLLKIDLPDPVTMRYDGFEDAPKRNVSWEPVPEGGFQEIDKDTGEARVLTTEKVLYPTVREETIHSLFKIELPDPVDTTTGKEDDFFGTPGQLPSQVEDGPVPDIEIVESDEPPPEETQELEIPPIDSPEREPEPERMIHGILELKPPEVDDAPFLTLTYDFGKIPHSFRLSKNYSIMEYSYYKYKPMLMKAQEFARRKMLKNALNYYRVIKSQNIPPELKKMINRNILDITEFLEKYLMSKGG